MMDSGFGTERADSMHADIFFGRLTPQLASVYVQIPRSEATRDSRVVGDVVGPKCTLSETLPGTFRLHDLGAGPTLLAKATILDPCFWSQKLPAIYEVQWRLERITPSTSPLEVRSAKPAHDALHKRQSIGLRLLVPQGNAFVWEGKRWVLRAVDCRSLRQPVVESVVDVGAWWRESRTALVTEFPTNQLCESTSQEGIPVLVQLAKDAKDIQSLIRQIVRWPSVIGVLTDKLDGIHDLRQIAPNLLIGFCGEIPLRETKERPDFLFVEASRLSRSGWRELAHESIPVVISRRSDTSQSEQALRCQLDELQRDLADLGRFAGYVV